jgi:hypothetical protein
MADRNGTEKQELKHQNVARLCGERLSEIRLKKCRAILLTSHSIPRNYSLGRAIKAVQTERKTDRNAKAEAFPVRNLSIGWD